jgi:adenosine/AMP kinase
LQSTSGGLHKLCAAPLELTVVPFVKLHAANFIFRASHFIKTVEDRHEALV